MYALFANTAAATVKSLLSTCDVTLLPCTDSSHELQDLQNFMSNLQAF